MKFTLNLASRRYLNSRALSNGFIAALCLLLLFGGWTMSNLMSGNKSLQQNLQRLTSVEQKLQGLRGDSKKPLTPGERVEIENENEIVLSLQQRDAFRWTELLDRMEGLVPDGVRLKGFSPNYKKNNLSVSGQARGLKEMRTFLDRLNKSSDLQNVYLKNHSRITVKDYADKERSAISFSLQLEGVF